LGGVETHVYQLALGLAKAGVSTEVFTTDLRTDIPFRRFDGEVPPVPSAAFVVRRFRAVKVMNLPHGLGILSPSMAVALFQAEPGVVHAHAYGYFPLLAGGLAEMLRGMPLVVTAHSDPGGHTFSKRLFDWAVPAVTLRRADRVIALTNIEAQNLQRLGVDAGRIRVIPNGVDLKEFEDVPNRHEPRDEFALLFVGRCYPRQKGLEHLISALGLLLSKCKIHLTIVGEDWGGAGTLQALARALGVEKHVTFTGALPRNEVINAYASADAFVLPSLFEPFGIVLLEAMAAGLPVVASRVGGIPEVVSDGKTGLLVQPGDSRSLANALENLISDSALRRRLGAAGRVKATSYSWDGIVPQILDVYHEAMRECGEKRAG
jgi:glycogen(starch) synthase